MITRGEWEAHLSKTVAAAHTPQPTPEVDFEVDLQYAAAGARDRFFTPDLRPSTDSPMPVPDGTSPIQVHSHAVAATSHSVPVLQPTQLPGWVNGLAELADAEQHLSQARAEYSQTISRSSSLPKTPELQLRSAESIQKLWIARALEGDSPQEQMLDMALELKQNQAALTKLQVQLADGQEQHEEQARKTDSRMQKARETAGLALRERDEAATQLRELQEELNQKNDQLEVLREAAESEVKRYSREKQEGNKKGSHADLEAQLAQLMASELGKQKSEMDGLKKALASMQDQRDQAIEDGIKLQADQSAQAGQQVENGANLSQLRDEADKAVAASAKDKFLLDETKIRLEEMTELRNRAQSAVMQAEMDAEERLAGMIATLGKQEAEMIRLDEIVKAERQQHSLDLAEIQVKEAVVSGDRSKQKTDQEDAASKIAELSSELASVRKRLAVEGAVQEQADNLSLQLNEKDTEMTSLLTEKQAEMTALLNQKDAEIATMQTAQEAAATELDQLSAQVAEAEEIADKAKRKAVKTEQDAFRRSEELEAEIEIALNESSSRETRLKEKVEEQVAAIQKQETELSKLREDIHSKLDDSKAKKLLTNLASEVKDKDAELLRVREANTKAQDALDALQLQLEAQDTEMSALRENVDRNKLGGVQDQSGTETASTESLSPRRQRWFTAAKDQEIKQKSDEIDQKNEEIKQKNKEITRLKDANIQLEADKQAASGADTNDITADLQRALDEAVDGAEQEISDRTASLNDELKDAEELVSALTAQLEVKAAQVAELKECKQQSPSGSTKPVPKAFNDISKQLEERDKTIAALKKESETLTASKLVAEQQRDATAEALEGALDDAANQILALSQENTALKEANAALETSSASAREDRYATVEALERIQALEAEKKAERNQIQNEMSKQMDVSMTYMEKQLEEAEAEVTALQVIVVWLLGVDCSLVAGSVAARPQ